MGKKSLLWHHYVYYYWMRWNNIYLFILFVRCFVAIPAQRFHLFSQFRRVCARFSESFSFLFRFFLCVCVFFITKCHKSHVTPESGEWKMVKRVADIFFESSDKINDSTEMHEVIAAAAKGSVSLISFTLIRKFPPAKSSLLSAAGNYCALEWTALALRWTLNTWHHDNVS